MFSSRFTWSLDVNPLTIALRSRREAGLAVADLTEANPGRAGFLRTSESLAAHYAHPEAVRYDPDPRGMRGAREAVSAYYAERGVAVSPDDIRLCASTSEGYGWLLKLLTEPGDDVLAPEPSYPLFEYIAAMERVALRPWPMTRRSGRWRVDAETLAASSSARTRAILAVSPNNPTGSVLDADDLAALRRESVRRDAPLIVDEVFLDYAGSVAPRSALAPDSPMFVLSGLSKIAALPQAKLAWIVIGGPPEFRAEAGERLDHIADTYLSVSTAVQLAAPGLFGDSEAIRVAIRTRCDANERTLRAWCDVSGHGVVVEPREAGWYAVLRLPPGVDEERATVELLRREGVLVHPGHFFGYPHDEARWVVSLISPEATLAGALPAFDAVLRRL